MNQKLLISVKGKENNWTFEFHGNSKYLKEWREDGLEIYVIENSIPEFIVDLGLIKIWCFFQDLFHFKNPFNEK